jgi:hypothetical protein
LADLKDLLPGLQDQLKKRQQELQGWPVRPVEKPPGRPVFFSGEIPKVYTPEYFDVVRAAGSPSDAPWARNFEQLEPSSKIWWERLPGLAESPVGRFAAGAAETLADLPLVGGIFDFFGQLAKSVEMAVGYGYQAAFDEQLRSSDAIGFMLKHGLDPIFKDPAQVAPNLSSYSPSEQKVIAAWWAGSDAFGALRLGKAPGLEEIRKAFWIGAATSPLGMLGGFGEGMQDLGQLIYRLLGESIRWSFNLSDVPGQQGRQTLGDWGFYFRKPEVTAEEKGLLAAYGLDWLFDFDSQDPQSPWVQHRERRQQWLEGFRSGTYMGEYFGLPELIAQRQAVLAGTPPGEVQEAYYERLGALAFEVQLDSFLGQFLIDPTWLVTLAPVTEMARAVRSVALTSRLAPEIGNRIDDVARLAGRIDDLVRLGRTDDLVEAASELGKVAQAVDVETLTRAAGVIDQAATAATEAVRVGDAPAAALARGALDAALEELRPFAEALQEMRPMNRFERIVLAVSGGDPFHPAKWWARGPFGRINPFALSAEARADELINMIHNNLSPLLREARDMPEMLRIVKEGAAGAFGARLGHMFVSPMGRYTQRILREISRHADELSKALTMTEGPRDLLAAVAQVTGLEARIVVRDAGKSLKGAQAVYETLRRALAQLPDSAGAQTLRRMLETGQISAEHLFEMGRLLTPTKDKIIPFTDDLMRAAIMKHAVDAAVEIGIQEFGVRRASMLRQASRYAKSAESLIFLGLNPFYPVGNFYNNVITTFLRGSWGLILPERWVPAPLRPRPGKPGRLPRAVVPTIEDVWRTFKVEPARLHEGFGVAGVDMWDELAKSESAAEQAALLGARQKLRTTVWPTPKGVGGWFLEKTRSLKLARGPAAAAERLQSEQVTTTGMLRSWRQLQRGYSRIGDVDPSLADELRRFDQRLPAYLEDAVRSARNSDDAALIMERPDLRLNLETILRRAAAARGMDPQDLARVVDVPVTETVRATLEALGPRPSGEAVEQAFRQIEDFVQVYLDEQVAGALPQVLEEAASKTETEGARSVLQLLSEISEATFKRHSDHMRYLDEVLEEAIAIQDPELANRAWKLAKANADLHWARHWDWSEAVRRGIERGLRARGLAVPDAFVDSFLRLRQGSQSYIVGRNKLWDAFFDRMLKGGFADRLEAVQAAAAIYERLDRQYVQLTDLTEAARRQMDAIFVMVMPQDAPEQLQLGVRAWRETVNREVRRDMERVLQFQQTVRGVAQPQKHRYFQRFHQERVQRLQSILEFERLGWSMVGGDEAALEFFVRGAQEMGVRLPDDVAEAVGQTLFEARRIVARLKEEDLALLERSLRQLLPPDEEARVDRLVNRFATETERAALQAAAEAPAWRPGAAPTPGPRLVALRAGEEPPVGSIITSRTLGTDEFGQSLEFRLPPGTRLRIEGYKQTAGFRMIEMVPIDEAGNATRVLNAEGGQVDRISMDAGLLRRWEGRPVELPTGGLEPTAEDIPFLAGDAASQRWTGRSPVDAAAEAQVLAFGDVIAMPVSSMPRYLRQQIEWIARQLREDIIGGEPGRRIFRHEFGPGTGEVRGISSSYPEWYGQFLREFNTDRQAVLTALDKIIAGEGDRGPIVERLKAVALGELLDGPRGAPPDPLVMRLMGRPEEEVQEALRAWQATGFDPIAEEAASRRARQVQIRQSVLGRIYDQAEAGTVRIGDEVAEAEEAVAAAPGRPVLPDFDGVVGRQLYIGTGLDELWFEQGSSVLASMRQEALRLLQEPPARIAALPEALQARVRRYLDHMVGELREARFAAVRMSEGIRDMALLNYSRTYNFDNWLAVVLPFHFWYTHSILRWALASLDRPWIIANYAKAKLLMERLVGPNEGFPQRLRDHVKVDMPYAPPEAGDIWVNPFRALGLPFEQFIQPWARWQQVRVGLENRTRSRLERMLRDGEINQAEFDEAIEARAGPFWDLAQAYVRQEDESLHFDLMDFMNLSVSPHLPISVLWNISNGRIQELGPLPLTRSLKHVATILGVEPGVYDNVWGNFRKALGLPAFDQYDTYRVRRELSNMLIEGAVVDGRPVAKDAILLAMATMSGPLWDAANERVARLEAFRYSSRFFGIPANPYPEGEQALRSLQDEWFHALELRDKGDDRALTRFFNEHPEYEARLALWKTPEEQLQQFLVDQIWNWWWDAPDLWRDEAKRQLGPLFERGFVDKDTRAPEAIPVDVLTAWVHILGGTAPGELHLSPGIAPVAFTDERIARRLQAFYDTRRQRFRYSEQVWPLWQTYFALEQGAARQKYWDEHPILQWYSDWRRDFMIRNPDLIPYIEDDPERQPKFPSEAAYQRALAAQPALRWYEWQSLLGPAAYDLAVDAIYGDPLPPAGRDRLDTVAAQLGLDGWRDLLARLSASLEPRGLLPEAETYVVP